MTKMKSENNTVNLTIIPPSLNPPSSKILKNTYSKFILIGLKSGEILPKNFDAKNGKMIVEW